MPTAVALALPGTVRAIFRTVGHGPSLGAGRITRSDLNAYLALLRHTDTLPNELILSRSTVSPLGGLAASHGVSGRSTGWSKAVR